MKVLALLVFFVAASFLTCQPAPVALPSAAATVAAPGRSITDEILHALTDLRELVASGSKEGKLTDTERARCLEGLDKAQPLLTTGPVSRKTLHELSMAMVVADPTFSRMFALVVDLLRALVS